MGYKKIIDREKRTGWILGLVCILHGWTLCGEGDLMHAPSRRKEPSYLLWIDPAISANELMRSPFVQQIIDESLRLCPPTELAPFGLTERPSGWILIKVDTGLIEEGSGEPRPEGLRNAMLKTGWRDKALELKEALACAPEWGDGWVYHLQGLGGQALRCFQRVRKVKPEASPSEMVDAMGPDFWHEVTKSLSGLRSVEGWWESSKLALPLAVLAPAANCYPAMRYEWDHMREAIIRAAQANPLQERTWNLLFLLEQALDINQTGGADFMPKAPGRICEHLRSVEVAPGEIWPDVHLAEAILSAVGSDPGNLLSLAAWGLEVVRPGSENDKAQAAWGGLHIHALIQMGRKQEALNELTSYRERIGGAWTAQRDLIRNSVWLMGSALDPELKGQLSQGPLPGKLIADKREQPLVIQFDQKSTSHWQHLAQSDAFSLWATTELQWAPLPSRGLNYPTGGAEVSWRLVEGEAIHAKGEGLPPVKAMASLLSSIKSPILESLNRFAQNHSGHLGVRAARLRTLRSRPDKGRFTALMIEDSAFLCVSPPNVPVPTDMNFRDLARTHILRIEAKLRSWPDRVELWETWALWWVVAGDSRRGERLLCALPDRGGLVGVAPIPLETGLKVANLLVDRGHAALAGAWCRALWALGYQTLENPGANLIDRSLWLKEARATWMRVSGVPPER